MRTSEAGIALICTFEGFSAEPYLCPAGRATIGYGSTWDVNGDPVTMDHPPVSEEEARDLVARELRHVETAIDRLIKVGLEQPSFDAISSFTFNVGSGNLQRSTLRMKLNRGNYLGAANEFPKWRRAGGKILKGLVHRRAAEKQMFLEGIF